MDVLWAAVAICAIVSLVLYVLAASWQRMLRSHARAIRDLLGRIEALESMEDPFVRSRMGRLAPLPLEQVHILSFRLSERFWRDTLGATEQQIRHVHEHGTFLGSVKMEVWRSHMAITLRELLPQSKSAGWQTRSLDVYDGEPTVLWELCLGAAAPVPLADAPSLQLRYENHSVILAARARTRPSSRDSMNKEPAEESIVFRIPLEAHELHAFRAREAERRNDPHGADAPGDPASLRADPALASFSHQDERQGVDWQLHIRELNGRTSSQQWTMISPPQARRVC